MPLQMTAIKRLSIKKNNKKNTLTALTSWGLWGTRDFAARAGTLPFVSLKVYRHKKAYNQTISMLKLANHQKRCKQSAFEPQAVLGMGVLFLDYTNNWQLCCCELAPYK